MWNVTILQQVSSGFPTWIDYDGYTHKYSPIYIENMFRSPFIIVITVIHTIHPYITWIWILFNPDIHCYDYDTLNVKYNSSEPKINIEWWFYRLYININCKGSPGGLIMMLIPQQSMPCTRVGTCSNETSRKKGALWYNPKPLLIPFNVSRC